MADNRDLAPGLETDFVNAFSQPFERLRRAISIHPNAGIKHAVTLRAQARAERIEARIAGHEPWNEEHRPPILGRTSGAIGDRITLKAEILAEKTYLAENFRKAKFGELQHPFTSPPSD